MFLETGAVLALAAQCAPAVSPHTIAAIVDAESSNYVFAINVNGVATQPRRPRNEAEALDYFNGNVTNPFDELTWPSIAEGYLLVAQKAVSDALIALERANSVGWTKHGK